MFLVVQYHPDMPVVMEQSLYKDWKNANRKAEYLRAWLPPESHEDVRVIAMKVEDDPNSLTEWELELLNS
jgi:putative SOS response-associated peptidase YedK